jgi:hypothetical protein
MSFGPDFFGPEYRYIPRRADGSPDYFILAPSRGAFISRDGMFTLWAPSATRAKYDRWMKRCEDGWRETEDPGFVTEAIVHVMSFRQTIPAWLDDAVYAVCKNRRTPEQEKRARERAAHLARHLAVGQAKINGSSWNDAYDHAEQVLAKTPAAADAETCRKSYALVNRDFKAGHRGLYTEPLPQWAPPGAQNSSRPRRERSLVEPPYGVVHKPRSQS